MIDGDAISVPSISNGDSHSWPHREEWEDDGPLIWVPFLVLPLTTCMTLSKDFISMRFSFHFCTIGTIVPRLLQGLNVSMCLKQ